MYGATGAIGSAYVQLLKHKGLSVTAVCRGEHRGLMMSLGADKVVDFKTQDFRQDTERYDFVFDAVDKASFAVCSPLMRDDGVYTSSGGFENLFLAIVTPLFGRKRVRFLGPRDIPGNLTVIRIS